MRIPKLLLAALLSVVPSFALAKIQIVTTTEDLAALAREIGGDHADISAIAKGYQDPHFVDAKPSYLLKLKKADLFIQVGLELEVGWVPSLLTSARNRRILPGSLGFMEASEGCDILQKPSVGVDRSQGDVHPLGNPHFWLDPGNGRVIARNIARKLSALDTEHAGDFQENLTRFEERLAEKEKEWDAISSSFKGVQVVTYHNSWPNFTRRFGLEVVNFIEPKAGIPPSPGHIRALIGQIKTQKVPLLLVEPYFDLRLPEKIARDTGAKLLVFPPSVGGEAGIKNYYDLFDHDLKLIKDALNERG